MSELQRQARALGDPTRHGIFRYLVDAERPVQVAELTAHFGLNHNAIRQHLAKLVAAELVVESTVSRHGPGRPPLQYSVDPTVESRWDVAGPYERLSRWLAEVIRTGDTPREVGRRVGAGQVLVAAGDRDPIEEISQQMARQGFDPVVEVRDDGTDLVLRACPFAATALGDPETVCNLHLGFAEGLAAQLGGVTIGDLHPTDPRRARCRLTTHPQPD